MLDRKPSNYWTKERCTEVALKCETKTEFQENYLGAYKSSKRNNWFHEICSHMKILGNYSRRLIYGREYIKDDVKLVYIGLTCNMNRRHEDHSKTELHNNLINSGFTFVINQLSDFMSAEEASDLEGKFVEEYRDNGWIILNKIQTGGLGNHYKKWTKEKCHEIALKYKTKTEFTINNWGAYLFAYRQGFLNEICLHMIEKNHKWTKKECDEIASQYKSRAQFQNENTNAYMSALNHKWLNEICGHMSRPENHNKKWTKEKCLKYASKCATRLDFIKKYIGAYNACRKNNWLDEVCLLLPNRCPYKGKSHK